MHKPLMITKELDKSTPLLYNVLVNNENIPEWKLEFWTPQIKAAAGTGAEVQHYTIELTNANIASIQQYMLNNKRPRAHELFDTRRRYPSRTRRSSGRGSTAGSRPRTTGRRRS